MQNSGIVDRHNTPRRSIFRRLFFAMLAFGALVGILFPPMARVVLDSERALSGQFIAMCIMAGLAVGLANYYLFSVVVSRQLARIVDGMRSVLSHVAQAADVGAECTDACSLDVTSNDAIGEIEQSFNDMTDAISRRLVLETASRHLSLSLSRSVELADVAETVLTTLLDVCGAQAGLLYGDSGESYDLMCNRGVDAADTPLRLDQSLGPVQECLSSGKMMRLLADSGKLTWFSQSTPLGTFTPRQMLCIPLVANQRPTGVAILAGASAQLSDNQQQVLDSLRAQAAPYLQNAILHRKVTDLAAVDDLTRILNRRFGLRRLQEEFSRAVRHGTPLSVVLLDADHFKRINDMYGHDVGDRVLQNLAKRLEENVRAGDVTCRYGGEEFLIVMPGSGLKDAAALADRMRALVETMPTVWGDQQITHTVSCGVATWPIAPASVPEELVTAADRALYAAKENGRNQTWCIVAERPVSMAVLLSDERYGARADHQ